MGNQETDPLDIRTQEQAQADQAERERLKRLQSDEDFRWLMAQEPGRRFMWELLGTTGVFRNAFTGDSRTYFRCGEQNIGQQLMARIHEVCPERYQTMVKEQKRDDGRSERNRAGK